MAKDEETDEEETGMSPEMFEAYKEARTVTLPVLASGNDPECDTLNVPIQTTIGFVYLKDLFPALGLSIESLHALYEKDGEGFGRFKPEARQNLANLLRKQVLVKERGQAPRVYFPQ